MKIQLGILGGGQLARMLVLKAHEMGVRTAVLSASAEDPAAQVTSLWIQGNTSSENDLRKFLGLVEVATFESEFMDANVLERLQSELGLSIFPTPAHMGLIQDRLSQKELLVKHGLPTSPYVTVATLADAREAWSTFGGAFVLKKRRFGYDGYGTFVIRRLTDLEPLGPTINENEYGFIAEKFVPFKRELSVMIARSREGEMRVLPFVETFQENSRCLWVKGPLKGARLSALEKKLVSFLKKTGYVGVMGVELFETASGVLVNELAPRVHNSGHYSLNALSEDQFTLHVKAVLGDAFSDVALNGRGFAMYNLLGSSSEAPSWELVKDVHLHWYGKSENRAGRKMGHLNAVASTPVLALARLKKARKKFRV